MASDGIHICNSSTWEAKVGKYHEFKASIEGRHSENPFQKTKTRLKKMLCVHYVLKRSL